MSQCKEETDGDRSLALLHQLARHVVDGCNVVRVNCVTKPKTVRQYSGSNEYRLMGKLHKCPNPRRQIGENKNAVNQDDPAPKAEQFGGAFVPWKNHFRKRGYGGPSIRKTFSNMSPQRKNRPMGAHRTPEG
jgi:hypothetical protein